jgi:hypothetical protein
MTDTYTYDINNRVIKKNGNFLARLTDQDSPKIIKELNRLDRQNLQKDHTIKKIKEAIL